MNGENQETRYHAEVKINIEGHEARVNVFADTLVEIFKDIGQIISQFPPDWKSPARQLKPEAAAVPETPVCQECGTDEFMELISFTDKKTGKSRQAWKCQQCQKWHWESKNGKG